MEENELILACQRGDQDAFEQLVGAYERRVYSLCYRMCGNAPDAEEAAQDTFLALWRGIRGFRGDAAFSTWLYRLASNACLDLLRRRRGETVSLDDEETHWDAVDPGEQPQERVERSERQETLRRALASLPEEYRAALLLREAEGLRYEEIAEALGIELGTVKSRICRGRRLLRDFLAADGNFFTPQPSKDTEISGKGDA